MNLIDFIFNNLIFIIILLWFLFGLFGRRNQEQDTNTFPVPEDPTQNQPEPDVEGGAQQRSERPARPWETIEDMLGNEPSGDHETRTNRTEAADAQQQSNPYEQYLNQSHHVQNLKENVQDGISDISTQLNEARHVRQERMQRLSSKTKDEQEARRRLQDKLAFQNLDQKQVVQGFVWAEVLGSPRAKRKHRVYSADQRLGRRHYP